MREGRVIAFAGPSLPQSPTSGWRALLSRIDLRPPAKRGDILTALCDHPRALVLLDGLFHTVPSVTHKELLYAIDSGAAVIGAASMGALRAAELEPFGMTGIGCIFELFRTGELEGDDEVAILHAPGHLGYTPVTAALVEIRLMVRALVSEGVINPGSADAFIDQVKALSFQHRHWTRIHRMARRAFGRRIASRLETERRRLRPKERDARRAVETALSGTPASPGPRPSANTSGPSTSFLQRFKEQAIRPPGPHAHAEGATVLQSWFAAQLLHPYCADFVRWLRLRFLLFSEATYAGVPVAAGRHALLVRTLRAYHERRCGSAWLPSLEYDDEGRIHAMAEAAVESFGSVQLACISLARRIGLDSTDADRRLLRLLEGQPDALPSWWQARAFTFTESFSAGQRVASQAYDVFLCFRRWSSGAAVDWRSLADIAASLWACDRSTVFTEAARRGLFLATSASQGLRDALELVAAAERLPMPVNQYLELRRRLQESPLRFGIELEGVHREDSAPHPIGSGFDASVLRHEVGAGHGRRPGVFSEVLYASVGMPDQSRTDATTNPTAASR
jgi:hypothetical protein